MYCCAKCNTEIKDTDIHCPTCGKPEISHEQQIINDEKLRLSVRKAEKSKNNIGCSIFIIMIMLIICLVILFVLPGTTSFGGWIFIAITVGVIYSVLKTISN